ncbi:hypothetical protein ZMO02_17430 [Zymomonas mobilis subsp. pomaceae]|nr:hypothetical protein ZMO02_17430 [Zymomonas mobilis subsp. pomaceae]
MFGISGIARVYQSAVKNCYYFAYPVLSRQMVPIEFYFSNGLTIVATSKIFCPCCIFLDKRAAMPFSIAQAEIVES